MAALSQQVTGDDSCAICLDEFEVGQTVSLVKKCGHVLHADCMTNFIKSSTDQRKRHTQSANCNSKVRLACPLCRGRFTAANVCSMVLNTRSSGDGMVAVSQLNFGLHLRSAGAHQFRVASALTVVSSPCGFARVLGSANVSSLRMHSTGSLRCEPLSRSRRTGTSPFSNATCMASTACGYVIACSEGLLHLVSGSPSPISRRVTKGNSLTSNISCMSSDRDVIAAYDAHRKRILLFRVCAAGQLNAVHFPVAVSSPDCSLVLHNQLLYILNTTSVHVYSLKGECVRIVELPESQKNSCVELVKFKGRVGLLQRSPPALFTLTDDDKFLPVQVDDLDPTSTLHNVLDFNDGVMLVFRGKNGSLDCKQYF